MSQAVGYDRCDHEHREKLEPHAYYVARARESLAAAQSESLPHRAQIHAAAAKQWISLAEKAAMIQRKRAAREAAAG